MNGKESGNKIDTNIYLAAELQWERAKK